jgi:hypothetical protein
MITGTDDHDPPELAITIDRNTQRFAKMARELGNLPDIGTLRPG